MSQLVRLEGKHTTQNAHCAMTRVIFYRGKAGPRLHLLIPGGTASTSSHPQT